MGHSCVIVAVGSSYTVGGGGRKLGGWISNHKLQLQISNFGLWYLRERVSQPGHSLLRIVLWVPAALKSVPLKCS